MHSQVHPRSSAVSNLVPCWAPEDGGGRYEAAGVDDAVVQLIGMTSSGVERVAVAPELVDPATAAAPVSAFSYDLLHDADATWAEQSTHDDAPEVDYDVLRRRDIARELLRARLIHLAEQREHRSAFELAFLMLIAAVAVLLAAPPLVQVFLAMHGTQV